MRPNTSSSLEPLAIDHDCIIFISSYFLAACINHFNSHNQTIGGCCCDKVPKKCGFPVIIIIIIFFEDGKSLYCSPHSTEVVILLFVISCLSFIFCRSSSQFRLCISFQVCHICWIGQVRTCSLPAPNSICRSTSSHISSFFRLHAIVVVEWCIFFHCA